MLSTPTLLRRIGGVLCALVLTLAISLPAKADVIVGGITVVDGDVPLVSDNIDLLGTVPVVGAISANFRGNYMFVTGVEGLSTFDISNPALPLLTSFIPLPHFENEDVSLGGNLLLIANDKSESAAVLYVFDISNPAAPRLRTVFPIGTSTIATSGLPSHTVTCLNGCDFAYLAGSRRGIGILDLRNPDAPVIAGEFKPPITDWATHDVQIDSQGIAWIVGAAGTAAYNIADPRNPVLVGMTDASATTGPLNDFIHHNSMRLDKITPTGKRIPSDVVLITEEDYERPTCQDAGSFQTWKINGDLTATTPAVLTNLDSWATELDELTRLEGKSPAAVLCSAHWFDEDRGLVAQGWYEQGTRILDVRNPADIKQVGYFVMPVTETWAAYWAPTDSTGQILYTVDLARGVDILRIQRPAADGPAKKAPVRKQWIGDGSSNTAPASEFSVAHTSFGWACRLPDIGE
ncbi:MAG: hypothetical protein M3R24_21165 [Chloroflexota bacterium]|nr:hypothetical protein [Chloroflexota bacterium]